MYPGIYAWRKVSTVFIVLYLGITCRDSPVNGQISTNELESDHAEEIANRTYMEEMSELQHAILAKYNRRRRPIRNESAPITVDLHVYLMHLSVDQNEQTLILHGHVFMSWKDEFAVWEASEHNGISTMIVRQWEVWTPDLKITNSVSGVGQYFEISRRSHITVQSQGKNFSRMEMYPTFAIKIGCKFDYSAYPYDEHICPLGLFTSNRMSEIQLSVLYDIQPTVLLGWGSQSEKKHISDWQLVKAKSNLSYFSLGGYSDEPPQTAEEIDVSWSILYTWIHIKRNAPYFGPVVLLPLLLSLLLITISFLMPSPESAIYALIGNFFFIAAFMEDIISRLPPATGRPPRIVFLTAIVILLNTISIGLEFWLRSVERKKGFASGWLLFFVRVRDRIRPKLISASIDNPTLIGADSSSQASLKQTSSEFVSQAKWIEIYDVARLLFVVFFTIVFLISLIMIFV
ncbi:hypothetical protein AB6A40_000713 [Gnathostoma spinigerum]|uniref:Neurotransmitter-gated ion-channel ligand-binding domain-containing protein n=1 Tax=Gnathostoma spinigerum TaxID=75299 RepID=A0ABD6E765_9BILA